jgi:uncharacterized membrane protein (DUF485 family)
MQRRPNRPAGTWQQSAITFAVIVGIATAVISIVLGAALLQRTCTVYDLTGREAQCRAVPLP